MRATPTAIAVLALALVPLGAACDAAPEALGADALAPADAAATDADAAVPPARCVLPPDAKVSLPADDMRHDAPSEWFYWTGHLATADGRWIGFQITVLAAGPPGSAVAIAHHSLTDATTGTYRHAVEVGFDDRSPTRGFELVVGAVDVRGDDGVDHLITVLDESRLELDLVDARGAVARHGNGFKDYGAGISTFYYSRPRMRATGTWTVDGEAVAVSGDVWFDHQWGALAPATASRWDWLGVQLDDGRELMVTRLPLPGGALFGYAELTDRDCVTTTFDGPAVALAARREWTNPETLCTYPSGWDLIVGALELGLEPVTEDQEIRAEPVGYWEGAAVASGGATGRAYVELVGYCKAP